MTINNVQLDGYGVKVKWTWFFRIAVIIAISASGYFWYRFTSKAQEIIQPEVQKSVNRVLVEQLPIAIKPILEDFGKQTLLQINSAQNDLRRERDANFVTKSEFYEFRKDQHSIAESIQRIQIDMNTVATKLEERTKK